MLKPTNRNPTAMVNHKKALSLCVLLESTWFRPTWLALHVFWLVERKSDTPPGPPSMPPDGWVN